MTKMLNLDDFAAPTKTVTILGKKYVVRELDVAGFMAASSDAERMEKENLSTAEQIELSLAGIKRQIPDIEDDVLRGLSLEQMTVLAQFVRGDFDAAANGAEKAPAKKSSAGKK